MGALCVCTLLVPFKPVKEPGSATQCLQPQHPPAGCDLKGLVTTVVPANHPPRLSALAAMLTLSSCSTVMRLVYACLAVMLNEGEHILTERKLAASRSHTLCCSSCFSYTCPWYLLVVEQRWCAGRWVHVEPSYRWVIVHRC